MYKGSSKNRQQRVSHISLRDVPGVPESIKEMSREERRDILARLFQRKQQEIRELNNTKSCCSTSYQRRELRERRARLVEEQEELQRGLTKLNVRKRRGPEVRDFYITAAKELLSRYQQKRIMDRAVELLDAKMEEDKQYEHARSSGQGS